MKILGISAYYHDSAAALLVDGEIVAAAQEERFSRRKFDPDFPAQSIRYCLKEAGLELSEIDHVVYYEKPFVSFERLLESLLTNVPRSFATFLASMPIWLREKLNTRRTLKRAFKNHFQSEPRSLLFSAHHLSHAASAFYPSPFSSAAVLCLDGVGEWATASAWTGDGSKLESLWEMHFPHSLGLLYSAFTFFCGFKVNSGEYKLMGLAPYGEPRFVDLIQRELVDIKEDGSFQLNMNYFAFDATLKMLRPSFSQLFGVEARSPEGPMTQTHKDLAASIQRVTEEIMLKMVRRLKEETNSRFLCLAGGVALNCVANGLIKKEKIFEDLWIQPAAGDAGGALGAALAAFHLHLGQARTESPKDQMKGALLGPEFSDTEIEEVLLGAEVKATKKSPEALVAEAVQDLKDQKVIGWFQGRMEYGPRALGNRSILGDARDPKMQSRMNLKIKDRESFRPFAPVVLKESAPKIFEADSESPYMLLVSQVRPESRGQYPAVTHVDGSARLQTLDRENPRLRQLLEAFQKETGHPLLVNTSFNLRGEPIVCSPSDALRCFVQTQMDVLYIGSYVVRREENKFDRSEARWKVHRELD